ncbi:MAG: ArgE/DapE family deacylase [Thermomicrobiales bacterium]
MPETTFALDASAIDLPPDLVERVTAAIDARQNDLVALLQELVRIPSENPKLIDSSPSGEANVQDRVAAELEAIGAEIDRWDALPRRPDQVGVVRGAGNGRSLALNAHIDTVPAGDASEWSHPPFAAEIADGMLWGRGAMDPKGGLAANLFVARILHDLGLHLNGDLFIEAVIDEETGGPGTKSTVERGYRPDFAVVVDAGEPIEHIITTQGGLEWLRVTVSGIAGHSAARYLSVHAGGQGHAVSAFDKGVKIVNAVAELERMWGNRKYHPMMPKGITTINVGAMTAGSGGGADGMPAIMNSVSALPDYCAIDLSLKYLPDENAETVKAEFEEYLHHICQADWWLKDHPPTIEWGLHGVSFPPCHVPGDHPAVTMLADTVRGMGRTPELRSAAAVGDIAWYAEAGIPAVFFGPAEVFNAHGSDEHIEIASLVEGVKAIALFTLAWCGVADA